MKKADMNENSSRLSDLKNRSEKRRVKMDSADFEDQSLFYRSTKSQNMNRPDTFAADFL